VSEGIEIRAPLEQTEGTRSQVLRWLKRAGDHVSQDEPLLEIETDKVTVEIAAPGSGVLREILKHEQEEIAPGELLGLLDSGEAQPATPAAAAKPGSAPAIRGVPERLHAAGAGGALAPGTVPDTAAAAAATLPTRLPNSRITSWTRPAAGSCAVRKVTSPSGAGKASTVGSAR